jgi:hypothetical protein
MAGTTKNIAALIKAIRSLPEDEAVVTPGKWYRTQKEHWLGWLSEYHGPGAYGRTTTAGRDAAFAYNHIVEPKMLLYLAAASNINPSVVAEARRMSACEKTKMAQAASIRRLIPWSLVETALWP